MNILQGNAPIGIWILRILGFLGIGIATFSHFLMWHTISTSPRDVVATGIQEGGIFGLVLIGIFAILLLLNSVYAILPAICLLPYVLEQVVGLHLLRYMPFSTTKLGAGLYLYLPFGIFLILLGSLAPILSHISQGKKS